MVEADHASLVRSAAGGGSAGRAAEAEICRRFAPRIRLYGLRHLRSDDRAADLVQLVLIATLEAVRRGAVDQPDRLDRFVLGTCRNSALRMRERDARLEPRAPEEFDVVGDSCAAEPAVEKVDLEALFRCLAALPERPRAVVQLSFTEERTADEIATALGTTAANVRVLRHRAIAQLRECLDGGGAAPRGTA
jgi:RNA polymerase sigma-70 factor, ECF subfamily